MAPSETNNRQDAVAAATRRAAETRIDVAHQAAPGESFDQAAQPQPIASPAEAAGQQIRTQAAQLAEHLRTRQKDLDHCEAELNARVAQFENDMGAARLWLSERMAELQERKQQPDEEHAGREEALKKTAEQLDWRQKQIEAAQALLAEQRAETQKLQERLSARRAAIDREEGERRQLFEAERGRMLAELEEQRRAVARRSERVDRSRAALEQLRGELGQLHRETLEIRLATEELSAQLSGVAPPAALIQSLGNIRNKLADHYRSAQSELRGRKEEIEALCAELVEQHQQLAEQKRQFDEWSAARQAENQQEAARLIACQRGLDRREAAIRQQAERWEIERLELQQELGRLRADRGADVEAESLAVA